jgi:hypothetical protein
MSLWLTWAFLFAFFVRMPQPACWLAGAAASVVLGVACVLVQAWPGAVANGIFAVLCAWYWRRGRKDRKRVLGLLSGSGSTARRSWCGH